MKPIIWLGDTHRIVKEYPASVRQEIGYNLDKLQRGLTPYDYKPMPSVGQGVYELRIHSENEYRLLYISKLKEAIYVLHCFIKKTEKTSTRDLSLSIHRLSELMKWRKQHEKENHKDQRI